MFQACSRKIGTPRSFIHAGLRGAVPMFRSKTSTMGKTAGTRQKRTSKKSIFSDLPQIPKGSNSQLTFAYWNEHFFYYYIYIIYYILLVMLVMNTRFSPFSCELLPPNMSDVNCVDYDTVPEHGTFKSEHGTQNGTRLLPPMMRVASACRP